MLGKNRGAGVPRFFEMTRVASIAGIHPNTDRLARMKLKQLLQAMAVVAIASVVLTACQHDAQVPQSTLALLGPAATATYWR
ncbi:MAG: hypothetical protein EOO80_06695 [Oxalobacteraceae bacterium]|nr:MAG: hypothetical protein EOO80_06695 [Oxalobacteraceae bacterium]